MKIAVYSIAKNEAQFVQRWIESAADADYRFILDTGSTDGTQDELETWGVDHDERIFTPWRFDAARELSLALLPSDVDWCIALDLDEELKPGWRQIFEQAVSGKAGNRLRYEYIWSWREDGTPDLIYYGDKIHRRHTHYWKHPVHEVLKCKGMEEQLWVVGEPLIEHHPDNSKSRANYLPLLRLSVIEDPSDDRNAHYYGRELYYGKDWQNAITELKRHLSLPSARWRAERAASMKYISHCYWELGETWESLDWMQRATREEPGSRDLWCYLGQTCHDLGRWVECVDAVMKALEITERGKQYMSESRPWGAWPYHLLSVAQWHLGDRLEAISSTRIALRYEGDNKTLIGNLKFMLEDTNEITEQPITVWRGTERPDRASASEPGDGTERPATDQGLAIAPGDSGDDASAGTGECL